MLLQFVELQIVGHDRATEVSETSYETGCLNS